MECEGLNKLGKNIEVSSRPNNFIMIETRVKKNNVEKIREKSNLRVKYPDNYSKHDNRRIWLLWDDHRVTVKQVSITAHIITCGIYDVNGKFKNWLTAIYVMNQLEQRRGLWKDIKKIHHQQRGPWCLMGNFNNVLRANYRVGERIVHESE